MRRGEDAGRWHERPLAPVYTLRRDERPTALRFFFYGREGGDRVMPDDLKERLKAFTPPPVSAEVSSLEEIPSVYERPYERWNPTTKKKEQGTESIPLTARESERAAQRELSVLRLVHAGNVAVSGTTRRPRRQRSTRSPPSSRAATTTRTGRRRTSGPTSTPAPSAPSRGR